MNLEEYLMWIRRDLLTFPQPRSLILAARYLMTEFDRDLIPDWVALIAGGNPAEWNAVVEEAFTELMMENAQ